MSQIVTQRPFELAVMANDPHQLARLVERNCKAWERRLRGQSGPATIQDLRNVLEQLASLAEAVAQVAGRPVRRTR